ncbi:hypothetical protein [Chthonobacter rhizosphaerae]|uniref:hypothetical protein n=1 Tax=Chthonobacter rhizosphaerae TaxID=2735553 RepID=UPI0015EFA2D1|nr:hypothetical protein [Chthonobacter rhizosphaerae]
MTTREDPNEARAEAARREMERITAQSGAFAEPILTRSKTRLGRHFGAADVDEEDPVERRAVIIGRALSLLATVGLLVWLASAYL